MVKNQEIANLQQTQTLIVFNLLIIWITAQDFSACYFIPSLFPMIAIN